MTLIVVPRGRCIFSVFTAAEASLEGRAHTEAINSASADQIMSSLPPCSDNCWMEEMPNNNIFYPSEAYELDVIPAEVVATAEHLSAPLSGQEGDQQRMSATYIDNLGWMTYYSGSSPPLPAFNWETSLHTDSSLLCSVGLWEPFILMSPPESALAGVAASAAAVNLQPPAYNNGYRMEENADNSDTCEGYEPEMTAAGVATFAATIWPGWYPK